MALKEHEKLEADVLVIGTGLAGLRATIEARRNGARVLVADKVVIATSNNTSATGSAILLWTTNLLTGGVASAILMA